jgi:hypothetical protein
MGYSTNFSGELKFAHDVTVPELTALQKFLGADVREHKEWNPPHDLYFIDLELLEDFTGLKWDGSEKTYELDQAINLITREMRKEFPEFKLQGQLLAQGEDAEDRWMLVLDEQGIASKQEIVITGQRVKCLECGHKFVLEG